MFCCLPERGGCPLSATAFNHSPVPWFEVQQKAGSQGREEEEADDLGEGERGSAFARLAASDVMNRDQNKGALFAGCCASLSLDPEGGHSRGKDTLSLRKAGSAFFSLAATACMRLDC